MNIYRELILSYLEEDNTQRVYFRVKPLLAASGDVQEEARAAWGDEGALRIVPDRAEQYHFKDRMRTLGSFCIMDLTHTTEDANKIRTNKNYNPARGECNQYILYSDAVQPLPRHSFFQVLEGRAEQAAELAVQAITPLFYLQDGETLLGPLDREQPAPAEPAAPAEGTLYALACPDGVTRSILCMPAPEAAAAPETPADETLAIGETLHILDEKKGFDEQLTEIAQPLSKDANLLSSTPTPRPIPRAVRSAPLSGTPLMRGNFRAATPKPKNQLQEVVAAKWQAARYEPPASPLPAGATLHPVENPVEEACRAMTQAWKLPEAQQQLLDHMLSLPGMGQRLTCVRTGSTREESPLQAVLTARLQDMEAERLAALVELDKAKANVAAFRQLALEQAQAERTQELTRLEARTAAQQASLADLQTQLTSLTEQRDAILAQIDSLQGQALPTALAEALARAQLAPTTPAVPLRLSPVPGAEVSARDMIQRVIDGLAAAGWQMPQADAVTLLALLACCPRFALISPQLAPARELMQTVFAACGWSSGLGIQEALVQRPIVSAPMEDATPAALVTPLIPAPSDAPLCTVMLGKTLNSFSRTAAWEMTPWPLWQLPEIPVLNCASVPEGAPISGETLAQFAHASGVADDELDRCLAPLLAALQPLNVLSSSILDPMKQFIRVASAYMEGGLATALDHGFMLWLGALCAANNKVAAAVAGVVSEYPMTSALLRRN